MMKKGLKYIFVFVLLILIAFLYGFSNAKNAQIPVQKPEIFFEAGDNNFLTQPMVNKLLIQNNEEVQNKAKSVIDLHELEKAVLSNPYVETATLSVSVGGVLKSTIKQRKPIARILTSEGQYYIDSQGVKVPIAQHYSARVPLVTGVENDEDLAAIYQLMQLIVVDEFLTREVIGVHKTSSEEYVFAVRSGNYKIEFGKLINIPNKIKKLKAFYSRTFLDNTIKNYKSINLKYHNQVVAVK